VNAAFEPGIVCRSRTLRTSVVVATRPQTPDPSETAAPEPA
jgi:hypothetical protein